MKSFAPLLIASLAGNVVLGALIVRREAAPVLNAAMALPTEDVAATTPAKTPAGIEAPPAGGTKPAATPPESRAPLWAGLKNDSIDEAIARLKSAGCTPREILEVVRAMIQEMTMERRQALGYANETLPYWQAGRTFATPRPANERNELYGQMMKLERKYLLTPEFFGADDAMMKSYRERFGPLETETLRKVVLLESERNEKSMQLSSSGSTQPGASAYANDPKQGEQLQKEFDAALQALLTPEQYAQYELRNGPVASALGMRLTSFEPSEAEYLALFAIEKAQRQTRGSAGQQTPEQRRAAQAEYQTALQNALGAERAADYDALQKAGLGDRLPLLLARLNLPPRTITTINAVREDTYTRARAIRENPQLAPDERKVQLDAVAAEAEADLGALLGGSRGLEAYKDLKGDWLRNLRNPPPTGR